MLKEIKQIHDYHQYHNLKTAFTCATYIAPLNYLNFRPWSPNGFTLTTWLQIIPTIYSTSHVSEEPTQNDPSAEKYTKVCALDEKVIIFFLRKKVYKISKNYIFFQTHLLSIGTNKLLLSIYLNSQDMTTMYFQLSKPNAQIPEKKPPKISRSHTMDVFSESSIRSVRNPCDCPIQRKRKPTSDNAIEPIYKENNVKEVLTDVPLTLSLEANKENLAMADEPPPPPSPPIGLNVLSSTCQAAIKTTRIAIRNSFSQFNLFSSSTNDTDYQSFRYPFEVKSIKLMKNKWTHFSFSVMASGKEISVSLTSFFLLFYCSHDRNAVHCGGKRRKYRILIHF